MELMIILSALVAACSAAPSRAYLPPAAASPAGSGLPLVRDDFDRSRLGGDTELEARAEPDGELFSYGFHTEGGISVEARGETAGTGGVRTRGAYSYTGDDGRLYSITYTAGEEGFVARGSHLPTAPPVPEHVLRALEQNARDEAAGIFDDGSYDERKYGGDEFSAQHDTAPLATPAVDRATSSPPREHFRRPPVPGRGSPAEEHLNYPENEMTEINERVVATLSAAYVHPGRGRPPSSYEVPLQSRTMAAPEVLYRNSSRPSHNYLPASSS